MTVDILKHEITFDAHCPVRLVVRVDPLGPLNKIIQLVRSDGSLINSVLWPVGAGAAVTLGHQPPNYWTGPGWRSFVGNEDSPPVKPAFDSIVGGYYVEVDGGRVLEVSELDILVPLPEPPALPLSRRVRAAAREAVDLLAAKLGYVPESGGE